MSCLTPADRVIIEILHNCSLVLSPRVVAYNCDYSQTHITDRLRVLDKAGVVTRVERGLYHLTTGTGTRIATGSMTDAERKTLCEKLETIDP